VDAAKLTLAMSPTTARQQLNPSGDWPISSKLTLDDQVTTASQRTGPCDPHTDIKRPISGGILMFRGSDAKDHTTMLILQGGRSPRTRRIKTS
jgi:hypothetical protein